MQQELKDLTVEDFERLGELLAGAPEDAAPMEPDMLDGYLSVIALLPSPPPVAQWLGQVFDLNGRLAMDPRDPWQAEVRRLVLRRGAQIERCLLQQRGIDPVVYDEDAADGEGGADFSALAPFAEGFALACSQWPALVESQDKAVQAALVGVLRYEPEDEEDGETSELVSEVSRQVAFASLDEAVEDLQACLQEIAEVTRAGDIRRAAARRPPARKPARARR
ncbi:MAG: UPF0149 family protein [Duodenibacillus sp.]|nr:UPF0149 family protein [Duodenibacillus sp.]